MKIFINLILRTTYLLIFCSNSMLAYGQKVSTKHSNNQPNEPNQLSRKSNTGPNTKLKSNSTHELKVSRPTPKVMETFENLTFWAETEERIFELATGRREIIEEEIKMLIESIVQFKISAGRNEQSCTRKSHIATSNKCHFLGLLRKIQALEYLKSDLHDFFYNEIPLNYEKHDAYCNRYDAAFVPQGFPGWPSEIDLMQSMDLMIYIQQIYTDDYRELPATMSPETRKPPQLDAFHLSEIGTRAVFREHYAVAVEMMKHALEKITESHDNSIPLSSLEASLELAVEMHNDNLDSSRSLPTPILFDNHQNLFLTSKRNLRYTPRYKADGNLENAKWVADYNFDAICSGKDFRTIRERSALYCWYDRTSEPARIILPYKKELLAFEPELVQFHDFIGDKLASILMNNKIKCTLNTRLLSTGLHLNTASTCRSQFPELETYLNKMSSLTLTNVRANGSYVPSNLHFYIPGQRGGVHLDTMLQTYDDPDRDYKVANNWDNLFSMLLYFNDVPAGGRTAFPNAGTSSLPIKGSAVVWKNMHRNGSMRFDTWHAACPVIYGRKQALVVGIHSQAQFLTYPCTLNQNE